MWQITSSMKTSSSGAKKRKASGERDLDVEIEDDDLGPSKQTQVMTSTEIKQEVCSTSSSNRAGTQVDSQFRDVSRGPSHADGIVLCGHCREMRATLCCMEKSCVSFAYRTWHMTSLFICDVCDITFHDNNPVMAEHLRSRLLIRNYNIDSLSQKEATPVSLHENENSAPTLGPSETTCTAPLSLLQDTGTGTDAPRQQVQNTTVSAARLPGRQLSNILMRVHERYQTVLKHNLSHHYCPLTETFRETKVARQTLVDAIGIAELKIVDPARYDEIIASYRHDVVAPRMLDVETVCRRVLNEYTDVINELRGKTIIPFRFNMYLPRGKPEQNS